MAKVYLDWVLNIQIQGRAIHAPHHHRHTHSKKVGYIGLEWKANNQGSLFILPMLPFFSPLPYKRALFRTVELLPIYIMPFKQANKCQRRTFGSNLIAL